MEVGKGVFSEKTQPDGPERIDYDIQHIMRTMLVNSTFIVAAEPGEGEDPNTSAEDMRLRRITHDAQIKHYYTKRPSGTADCLHSLRQYHYIDPMHALILPLPREFTVDPGVTLGITRRMMDYGLSEKTIQEIVEERANVIEYCQACYDRDVDCLDPEERTEEKLATLRATYLEFPCFPYLSIGLHEEDDVPICVSPDALEGGVNYAMSTSVPLFLGSDMLMIQSFLGGCISYMLARMETQLKMTQIDTATHVYFDFLEGPEATLYFFLNLQRYDD